MARELLLDTSGLVSILDRSQRRHHDCVHVYREWTGPVLTTEAVVTEATHLLGRVVGGARACVRFIVDGGATIVPYSASSLERCLVLMTKYEDLPLDYADASLVTVAEDVSTPNIMTLDGDFRTVRWLDRRAFKLYPGR